MIEAVERWKKRTIAAFILAGTVIVAVSLVLLEIHTLKAVWVFTFTR